MTETNVAFTIATVILQQDVKLWLAEPEETAYHLAELIDQEMRYFQRQGQKFLRLYRIANINSSVRGLKKLEARNIWIPTALHNLAEWGLFDALRSFYYIGIGCGQFERALDTLLLAHYGLDLTDHISRKIIQGNRPGLYASLIITEAQNMHADTVLLNLDAWTYFVQELQLKFQQGNNAKLVLRLHKILNLSTESEIKDCTLIKRGALGENTPCVVNLARFHIARLVTNIASQL